MSHVLPRRALAVLVLPLFVAFFAADVSVASAAVPGRPTARAPRGLIAKVSPTFTWSRASRATRYEVRVYRGSTQVLRKTGIARTSWRCRAALPESMDLTWRVRARNAFGVGRWSRRVAFLIFVPQVEPALLGSWGRNDYAGFSITAAHSLLLHDSGIFRKQILMANGILHGLLTQWGLHTDTPESIQFTNVIETWEPADDDGSGIPAYEDVPQPDYVWFYALSPDGVTLGVLDENGTERTWERVQ